MLVERVTLAPMGSRGWALEAGKWLVSPGRGDRKGRDEALDRFGAMPHTLPGNRTVRIDCGGDPPVRSPTPPPASPADRPGRCNQEPLP